MTDIEMGIAVQADEGDEVSISADFISIEQARRQRWRLRSRFRFKIKIETVTLTIDKARELAKALLSMAEAINLRANSRICSFGP